MKYLPALAGLLSLLACALWIGALCGPWYRVHDGTQQHMGLYKSYGTGKQHEQERGHNTFEDAVGITAARQQLAEKHKHKHAEEYDEYEKHGHKHDEEEQEKHHHHRHKHGHEHEEEEEDRENKGFPTLQPIIIQPTLPPDNNINAPTTSAPLQPQPTGPGGLLFGGGGFGGGGFGGYGGSGGGGGGWTMRPSPTAVPADSVPSEPAATPLPTSKHGRVYRQPQHDKEEEEQHEHKHKHKHEHEDDKERYEPMTLDQVDAGNIPETSQGATQSTEPADHEQGRHIKRHGTKHEIKKTNELPYDETWVKAMRILLILAIIVSAIAGLLQLIMACTVGNTDYRGWMTSPTTALVTTTLITLAALHGLIVFLILMSKRDELPHHHGHYDYAHTLNLVATGLSFLSPLLFWYTLDPYAKHESLLGEETMAGGRRKYASVE